MIEQPATRPDVPSWDTADRIRKALRVADLGVQELADYLEVSRTSVSNWINGRIDPSAQSLRLIAMRCGVSYSWLRTGETDTQSDGPNPGPGTVHAGQRGRVLTYIGPRKWREMTPIPPIRTAVGEQGPFRRLVAA